MPEAMSRKSRESQYAVGALPTKGELLRAAEDNDTGTLCRYMGAKGDLGGVRNHERQTLVHIASKHGAADAIAILMQSAPLLKRIDARDRSRRTSLHLAAAMGFDDCVWRLLESRAALDLQDERGCTPLHLAIRFDWPQTARVLLEARCDPWLKDSDGHTPVQIAQEKSGRMASVVACLESRRRPSTLRQLKRRLMPTRRYVGYGDPLGRHGLESSDNCCGRGVVPQSTMSVNATEDFSLAEVWDSHTHWQETSQQTTRAEVDLQSTADKVTEHESTLANSKRANTSWLSSVARPLRGSHGPIAHTTDNFIVRTGNEDGMGVPRGSAIRSLSAPTGRAVSSHTLDVCGTALETAPLCNSVKNSDEEFAMFRIHAFFDAGVQRLEFEVEWHDGQPSVGSVVPGGAADCCGVCAGDRLIEIGGVRTGGKGREQLLPLLRSRPLLLKIDRENRMLDPHEPRLELKLAVGASGVAGSGVEVDWHGRLPVITYVRPQSVAEAAGLIEGDALVQVFGKDASALSRSALLAVLGQGPVVLMAYRRPLGMDAATPWTLEVTPTD